MTTGMRAKRQPRIYAGQTSHSPRTVWRGPLQNLQRQISSPRNVFYVISVARWILVRSCRYTLTVFIHSDWASDRPTRKWRFLIGHLDGALISTQLVIAQSPCEAELHRQPQQYALRIQLRFDSTGASRKGLQRPRSFGCPLFVVADSSQTCSTQQSTQARKTLPTQTSSLQTDVRSNRTCRSRNSFVIQPPSFPVSVSRSHTRA